MSAKMSPGSAVRAHFRASARVRATPTTRCPSRLTTCSRSIAISGSSSMIKTSVAIWEAISRPASGNQFTIRRLTRRAFPPCKNPESTPGRSCDGIRKKGRPMPSILVLDDEPLISMLLEDWLAELGCETIGPVQSVQSALDAIARTAPDAAILDVSLQSENSYSVADVLRDRGVRFAFATGHGANALAPRFKD